MNNIKIECLDNINSGVSYQGLVTIKYKDEFNKRRIIKDHNEGGPGLFTCITRMLEGIDYSTYVPSKLQVFSREEIQSVWVETPLLTAYSPISGKPIRYKTVGDRYQEAKESDASDVIQYTFFINATDITDRTKNIDKLVLYNSRNEICASLILTQPIQPAAIASNVIIYWKLKFMNGGNN